MRLNFLFILMDLLTLLAYPFLFMYSKIRFLFQSKESRNLAPRLVADPGILGK